MRDAAGATPRRDGENDSQDGRETEGTREREEVGGGDREREHVPELSRYQPQSDDG